MTDEQFDDIIAIAAEACAYHPDLGLGSLNDSGRASMPSLADGLNIIGVLGVSDAEVDAMIEEGKFNTRCAMTIEAWREAKRSPDSARGRFAYEVERLFAEHGGAS